MRSRLITYLIVGLHIPAIWLIFCLIMRDVWFTSYNGLTMSLWTPLVFTGGVICAIAAWQEATHRAHHSTAIWLSTPRSWFSVRLREVLGGYLFSVLLPTLLSQTTMLLIGAILSLPGYLDLRYGAYALAFSFILYLLGTLTAHLRLGPLLSTIIALFLGLYAGMYIALTTAEANTWEILNPYAWEVIAICALILLLAIPLAAARRTITARGSRTTAIVGAALTVAAIFSMGGIQTSGYIRTDYENILCENSGQDTLCIWQEDSFKWDDIRAYLQRTRNLRAAARLPEAPILAIEPGIPQDRAKTPEEVEKQEYFLTYIFALGGNSPSWPAAQSFADILRWPDACSLNNPEQSDLLYDLLTNFIYGDITYNGFSTSDPELDGTRLDYSQELSQLSEEEQLTHLASALSSFTATCSYNPEEFRAHG